MSNEEIREILKEKLLNYVDSEELTLESIVNTCNSYDGGLEDYYYRKN